MWLETSGTVLMMISNGDGMRPKWSRVRAIANGLRDGIIMIIQVQNVCITIK